MKRSYQIEVLDGYIEEKKKELWNERECDDCDQELRELHIQAFLDALSWVQSVYAEW